MSEQPMLPERRPISPEQPPSSPERPVNWLIGLLLGVILAFGLVEGGIVGLLLIVLAVVGGWRWGRSLSYESGLLIGIGGTLIGLLVRVSLECAPPDCLAPDPTGWLVAFSLLVALGLLLAWMSARRSSASMLVAERATVSRLPTTSPERPANWLIGLLFGVGLALPLVEGPIVGLPLALLVLVAGWFARRALAFESGVLIGIGGTILGLLLRVELECQLPDCVATDATPLVVVSVALVVIGLVLGWGAARRRRSTASL